jgi:hypothetical protein
MTQQSETGIKGFIGWILGPIGCGLIAAAWKVSHEFAPNPTTLREWAGVCGAFLPGVLVCVLSYRLMGLHKK